MMIPCGHRIVVKPFKYEQIDDTYLKAKQLGLEVVRENQKREDASVDKGTVVSIGPDCWPNSDTPWCSVGDTILWARHAAKLVEQPDGSNLGILNDEDIVAVIKEA